MPRYRTRSWRAFDPQAVALAPSRKPAAPLRVLGLDPGSRRTGFGIIECRDGEYAHIAHGCIGPSDTGLAERLRAIFEAVRELIAEHRPDEIAVERVFVNRNVDSALKLGQARGAVLCAVPQGTALFEYAPRAVKLAVVGFGGAEKSQVAHMIKTILRIDGKIPLDAADALAVAICHANSRRLDRLIRGQGEGTKR